MSAQVTPESLDAYAKVQATKRETYTRILDYANRCGLRGFTADEVAEAFRCDCNHVAPRVGELREAGELVRTQERRPTRAGNLARVYVAPRFVQQAEPTQAQRPQAPEALRLFADDAPLPHRDLG
jgi:hypothetical protein